MTTVSVIIDPTGLVGGPWDISSDVVEVDIWRETLSGIGRFEIDLINGDGVTNINPYGATFAPDMRVRIEFNVGLGMVRMMAGYIDDINNYLEEEGYYNQMLKIKGRDHGMDLAQLLHTTNYQIQPAEAIVAAALAAMGSEILYAGAAGPNRAYDFDRTYLSDGIREIAETIDYDFYVTNVIPPSLQFFSIAAAVDTGIDFFMDVGGATNNILRFDRGFMLGYGIKNDIDVHMGGVKDHWSDENAQPAVPPPYGWIGGEADGNTTVSNIRAPPPTYAPLQGRSVIQWDRFGVAGNSIHSMYIDFSAAAVAPWTNVSDYYGYAGGTINLAERNDCHAMIRSDTSPDTIAAFIRPALIDNTAPNPNVIWFYAMLGIGVPPQDDDRQGYGPTDNLTVNKWYRLKFPVGDDLTVAGALSEQQWSHVPAGSPPLPVSFGGTFNWSGVTAIYFTSVVAHRPGYFWMDDLTIPGIEARYLTADAASIGLYGQRMYHEYRGDIGSQVQAVRRGESVLAKRKDPLQTVNLTGIGQTGIVYAGQLVDVRAPSHGIAGLTKFRIMKLHHNVAVSPDRVTIPGYDFITELELVRRDIATVDIPYDPMRMVENTDPISGQFQNLSRYNRRLMSSKWARER